MKIKIFNSAIQINPLAEGGPDTQMKQRIEEMEKEVNSWIDSQQQIKVLNMQTATCSHEDNEGTHSQWLAVTFLYS